MGRIRTIKPEFPHSETVGRLSRDARLLFIQLWTLVDDAGRTRASSRLLASRLYPFDDDVPTLLPGWLAELESGCFLYLYLADGNQYLEICNWLKHQKIDHPSASRLPGYNEILANPREDSRDLAPDLGPRTLDLVPRTLDQDLANSSHEQSAGAVFELPLKDGSSYGLPQDLYDEYVEGYPAIKVMEQLAAMRTWLLSNPGKRKTRAGIKKFINGWLARERDKPDSAPRKRAPRTQNFSEIDYAKDAGFAPGQSVGLI
jgi:hypothetical protein